jgi:hypothetical protein
MSGVPMSLAPLMSIAFTKAAEGAAIPPCSRTHSRTKAAEPPATAVACDVPPKVM